MRAEKLALTKEYTSRLNSSPFFIAVNYQGLKVGPMTELRKRLNKAGAEIHIVKNSIFRLAVKEAGIADLNGSLAGQVAVITGQKDVSAAAKVVKTFNSEFDKLKIHFGYLNNSRLEPSDLTTLADLPSIEVLRAKLMGMLNAPASRLLAMLNAPGASLARVLQARVDKGA